MSTSTTRSQVILSSSEDWDEWIELIKIATLKAKVQTFVNLDTSKDQLPVLVALTRPSLGDVKDSSTNPIGSNTLASTQTTRSVVKYSQLSKDEKQQLLLLQKDYEFDQKKYQQQEEALNDLHIRIQEMVKRDYLSYTFKCDLAYDMLVKLKQRFAPIDNARKKDLIIEWKKL